MSNKDDFVTVKVMVPATKLYCEKNHIACQFDEIITSDIGSKHQCLGYFDNETGDYTLLNVSKRGKVLRCKACKENEI